MKIMKVFDKKIGNKEYIKYRVNLPKELVEISDFLNKKLRVRLEKDKIVIEKES